MSRSREIEFSETDNTMPGPKDIVKSSFYHLGVYNLLSRVKKPNRNRLLILMYHDLVEDGQLSTVRSATGKPTRSQFSAHVETLKSRYRVMTIEDAIAEVKSSGHLTEPTAAITFDDGYTSTCKIAFPVLKALHVSATVYLPTRWISGEMEPWWLILADMARQCDKSKLAGDKIRAVEEAAGVSIDSGHTGATDAESLCDLMVSSIQAELESAPEEKITRVMDNLKLALFGSNVYERKIETAMSWEQAKEMAAAGIRFGAHSMSHVNVGRIGEDRAEREIQGSKAEIEKRLSQPVTGFAYPYGKDITTYPRVKPILERLDFDYAVTAYPGNFTPGEDNFMIRRITLPTTTSRGQIGRLLILDYLSENELVTGNTWR